MSDEQDLKLACLHHAGGDLDHAKALFEWVSGSVRATTDSEAPEVSAPDQDKPEEPFNYRHPSKFGTDIPRRCHLEELTPEERAIRDLVGTVESLGAHPLLTTTVIQLMKAGESLADWVDIELRDKAISALQSLSSGEGGVGLLDGEPEPVPTEVRTQDEQDAPADQPTIPEGEASDPEIPEGFTKWEGGECPLPLGAHADVLTRKCDVWPIIVKAEAPLLWRHENHDLDIIAYRVPELIEQPETIDDLVRAGFTTWYGGECPVADNVKVEAIDRAGSRYISDEGIATSLNIEWRHFDSSNDIIAYRIIETPAPPSPEVASEQGGESEQEEVDEAAIERGALAARCGLSLDDCPEDEPRPHEWASGWAMENPVHKLADPFAEGRASYVAGLGIDAVPSKYHPRSIGAGSWQDGWLAARGPNVYPEDAPRFDYTLIDAATSPGAERTKVASEQRDATEQSPEAYDPINKGEEPIIHPEAPFWGKALTSEAQADAKAEPKKFGGIFSFGAKKTLVGEGV